MRLLQAFALDSLAYSSYTRIKSFQLLNWVSNVSSHLCHVCLNDLTITVANISTKANKVRLIRCLFLSSAM